jgi:hypothetical protein
LGLVGNMAWFSVSGQGAKLHALKMLGLLKSVGLRDCHITSSIHPHAHTRELTNLARCSTRALKLQGGG